MVTNKTLPTSSDVTAFVAGLDSEQRRADSRQLIELMRKVTGEPPVMWGSSIIGFGSLHYKYDSGREGDTMLVGFAPRKQALVLYSVVYYDQNLDLAAQLGPHTTGKGCLYIKKLSDINLDILTEMIEKAYRLRAATES
jgi:hypothetical protein